MEEHLPSTEVIATKEADHNASMNTSNLTVAIQVLRDYPSDTSLIPT
jgi:hypothetical protein